LINFGTVTTRPMRIALNNRKDTLNRSEIESNKIKKAFKNEPPATLPQFLQSNLERELQQCDL